MSSIARWVGMVSLGMAAGDLAVLHLLPRPVLHATTGALIPYQPWNFLSEYARTDYAPGMTACFFLLALSALATASAFRSLRREAILLTVTGVALFLLGCFPTDLADLSRNGITCALPGRIEPCTMIGRIHNPLSTFVFFPILLVFVSFCVRTRTEKKWRTVTGLGAICGGLAVCGIIAAEVYLHAQGWQGTAWTGLMQRSLVFPVLLWLGGLLILANPGSTPERKELSSL